MNNLNNNYQNTNNGMPTARPNGQDGSWVPVDASSLPFTIGGDPNQPTLGPDGAYYCIGQSAPTYGQIAANQYNAIPTPSTTVQMPAIVQPIALVPYASQNQPLVQYNPNYQPEVPMGNVNDPVYKSKAYAGISVLLVLLSVVVGVVVSLLACMSVANAQITGIDAILSILQKFKIGSFSTNYFTNVLGPMSNSSDIVVKIVIYAIPAMFALLLIFALILLIKYLVKMGSKRTPRCFSVLAFIGFILSIALLALTFTSETLIKVAIKAELGMFIIVGVYLVLLIIPFFAKKGAVVVDLEASKRVYTH